MNDKTKIAVCFVLAFVLIFSLSLAIIFGLVIGSFLSGNVVYWEKFQLDYRLLWFDATQIAFFSSIAAIGSGSALVLLIRRL